jgi:dynein heavy chain
MKAELEVLKPQLVQASKETDELLINVEEETVEADKVKAVVSVDEASAKEEAAKVCCKLHNCETFDLEYFSSCTPLLIATMTRGTP